MTKHVRAVYEQGVFRPLEPVALQEHQEVTLAVSDKMEPAMESAPAQSCFELAQNLGLIGVVSDVSADLSTNQTHFEGFGRE